VKKMENIKYFISAVVGAFFSFFGILAVPLALLIPCNIIDYFTGMAAAKLKGEQITSAKSWNRQEDYNVYFNICRIWN